MSGQMRTVRVCQVYHVKGGEGECVMVSGMSGVSGERRTVRVCEGVRCIR